MKNFATKIQAAHASMASSFLYLSRVHRSQLYNSLTVSHLLALVPVWYFLNCGKRKQAYHLYFKFAKYLIDLPTWTINSFLLRSIGKPSWDYWEAHLWFLYWMSEVFPSLAISVCPLSVVLKVYFISVASFLFSSFLLCFFLGSAQFFCDGL